MSKKKRKRIFVLGYFGYKTNQLDGQTVKTRCIYQLLEEKVEEKMLCNLTYYDTQEFRYKKISFFSFFFKLIFCNRLIILPCVNNLKFIFPITYVFSKICNYKIIHIAIGGWQDEYFKKHSFLCKMTKNIQALLVENNNVQKSLIKNFNFQNTEVIPNFRIHGYVPQLISREKGLKIVFMSRIHRQKGLDIIFSIADYIQNNLSTEELTIDFYGPINPLDQEYFKQQVDLYDFVCYHGELQPGQIYTTLNQYDILILPTRYYTEGFPGAILDAYIAGIPVLVSNWKHAHEFVENKVSGFICNVDKNQEFINIILLLYKDKDLLYELKRNAWKRSKLYSKEVAWNILKKYIE